MTGGWYNPGGTGDPVSDYVNYSPWLPERTSVPTFSAGTSLLFSTTTLVLNSTQKLQIPAAPGQSWSLSSNAGWLNFDISSGTGPASVNVAANSTGLLPGTYYAMITILIGGVPIEIRVTLSVGAGGTINPMVAVSPESGPLGTTFTYSGAGFTPNNTATVLVTRANGTVLSEYAIVPGKPEAAALISRVK